MASETDRGNFYLNGPYFLTTIDWNNSYHRRSIAASLVKGVYTAERDRHNKRQGYQALAPPWWEFFNFELKQLLVDEHDVSYFGAIFKFKSPFPSSNDFGRSPPQYVIAFRGTIKGAANRAQDFKLNFQNFFNNLHNSTRFLKGIESVRSIVSEVGPQNVWLAGHSLGSSIALIIGRDMVKTMGTHLETYLFNSPFMSPSIAWIKNEKLEHGLRIAKDFIKAGLVMVANGGHRPNAGENDPFIVLSSWIPYLFINRADPICSEYGGYFEHREKMESIGAGKIGRIATQHSIVSIATAATIKNSEAIHLIPSAYLTTNSGPSQSFKEAHGIEQWWRPYFELQYKLYQNK